MFDDGSAPRDIVVLSEVSGGHHNEGVHSTLAALKLRRAAVTSEMEVLYLSDSRIESYGSVKTASVIVLVIFGLWTSSALLAQSGVPAETDTIGLPVNSKAAIGSKSLAILLLQFANESAPAYDRELVEKLFSEANEFYKEVSYGQFAFTWDIVGPLVVPLPTPCDRAQLEAATAAARTAASQAGVDLAQYNTLVLAGSGCGLAQAAIDGSHVWLLETGLNTRTVAHELGHSLGVYHADFLYCPSAPFVPLPRSFAPECRRFDADDYHDVMGRSGFHHFNAVFKEVFGWLTAIEVTKSGVYRIEPIESLESSVKAIKIRAGSGDFFYLEYRQPIGFDRVNPRTSQFVGMFQGALVRLAQSSAITSFSALLAMDGLTEPFPGFPSDPQVAPARGRPALTPGITYLEPGNRFSIKTLSATPEAIEVEVTIFDSEPEPRFSFGQPLDGTAVSGNIKVALVAAEPGTISKIELTLDGRLLESRMVNGSQLSHFDWNTDLALPGTHRLTATAYGKDGGGISTRSVDVVVHRLPTVTLAAQNQSVALGEQVRLLANVTTDEQATAKAVEFRIEGPAQSQRLTGVALSNGAYLLDWTPSERGTFTLWAEVEDSAGFRNWSWGTTATVADIAIASQGVVNAASFRSSLSPGSLISIFGGGFATNTVSTSSVPLPLELEGVTVTIGGFRAPILYVSATQINAQVPWTLESACSSSRRITVTVTGANGTAEGDVLCMSQAPGIFRFGNRRQALATHIDGSIAGPEGFVGGVKSHPARPGDIITLWGTGLGPVTPTMPDGEGSLDPLRTAIVTPVVTIGGMRATVTFAGLAPGLVGVNQLNVVVPADVETGDMVQLSVLVGTSGDRDSVLAISP